LYNLHFGVGKKKTEDIKVRNEMVKDEQLKRSIKITERFGLEAKKEFLMNLRNIGYKEYLTIIIENYKKAIESLPYLNDELEN
jgi:hypothetical protein